MAGSVNKVILIGNLGKDPEIKTMQDGREIARLTLATSESWKDKQSGERREKTEWHNISIFNEGLVNIAKNYLRKGSKVFIEGSLQTRKWQDQNGQDRYSTDVVLQGFNGNLTMLDSKGGNDSSGAGFSGGGQSNYSGGGQSFGGNAGGFGGGAAAAAKPADNAFMDEALDDDIPF